MHAVGITLGEPCGIGPELVVRCFSRETPGGGAVRVYGSPALLFKTGQDLGIEFFASKLPPHVELVPCGPDPSRGFFVFDDLSARAEAAVAAIERAHRDAVSGKISALVTAPIDKAVVRTKLPGFAGHTGYLARLANVPRTLMLMDNGEFRILLLTDHIPLRDVPGALTPGHVEDSLRLALSEFRDRFGIPDPKVALLGLNPHAGEIVQNAEEDAVFRPVIALFRKEGVRIEGPFPADSFFSSARGAGWDLVVSSYHDQGLIAAKYAGLHQVVNITLGLPYLRVSPGHGTAYDLVGRGTADLRSFERALRIAFSGSIRAL
ncbi:MAG: 4-hydroxythreonine-4-phosphate dehydrogenase PdxA [Pseudomonadota bacterium]